MPSTVQMNLGAASSFMSDIEGLNGELQALLGGVNNSVEMIGQDAAGSVVGELMNNANDMIQSTTELVNSFTGLVNAVGDVISKATGLVDTVVDGIAKVGKFFI